MKDLSRKSWSQATLVIAQMGKDLTDKIGVVVLNDPIREEYKLTPIFSQAGVELSTNGTEFPGSLGAL